MANSSTVSPDVQAALKQAHSMPLDAIGNRYHTFRVELLDSGLSMTDLLSQLVDHGWHMMGSPLVVEACDTRPRHILVSMMRSEPRPIEVRAHLNFDGRIEAHGELRGEASPRI